MHQKNDYTDMAAAEMMTFLIEIYRGYCCLRINVLFYKEREKVRKCQKGESMSEKKANAIFEAEKKYVSDVFDIDEQIEKYGNKIMLIAGVGSGKSTWVKDILSKKGSVLFVTSRRAKVDEDIKNSCFSAFHKTYLGQSETLITNAKLANILENAHVDSEMTVDDFLYSYDYIVVDEVHSMATDSTFARSAFDIFSFIEYAAEKGHKVIVMTGTPEPVQYYFEKNGWHINDYRKICNYVHPKAVRYVKNSDKLGVIKEALEKGQKVIYFVNNTATITFTMKDMLKKHIGDTSRVAAIVSNDKKDDVNQSIKSECLKYDEKVSESTYANIIEKQMLPAECQMLISTSRLKEGIDILNENVCMICDNHVLSNLVQFFGRVRIGGGTVYIVEDSQGHAIEHSELNYDYAAKEEAAAANKYLVKYVVPEEEVFDYQRRFCFIRLIENRNPYIRYNYIKKEFQVFDIKFKEEERLLGIKDWKLELKKYCDEYKIKAPVYMSDRQMKAFVEDGFIKQFGKDKRFYGEDWERIKNIIAGTFDIKYVQINKINEKLEEQDRKFRFYRGRDNSGEHRGEIYFEVVSPEELEKRQSSSKRRSMKKK